MYKRQVKNAFLIISRFFISSCRLTNSVSLAAIFSSSVLNFTLFSEESVSYTHLDVYKRQIYNEDIFSGKSDTKVEKPTLTYRVYADGK